MEHQWCTFHQNILLFFGGKVKSGLQSQILQFSFVTKKWTKWSDHVSFTGESAMSVLRCCPDEERCRYFLNFIGRTNQEISIPSNSEFHN